MPKVLLAEDDPLTLAGIKMLLANSIYDVIAVAANGTEALAQVPVVRPDILVLDVDMPERTGLDVLRTLRSKGDMRPIILLTGRINDQKALEALQLGVNGLVIKTAAPHDLIPCLDAVMQGRRWIDHDALQRAMDISLTPDRGGNPMAILSDRERAVAALVLRGLRNKDIAAELGITEGTVKVHLHKVFEKLGVASRTELIILAKDIG